jgi:hypothetical protein
MWIIDHMFPVAELQIGSKTFDAPKGNKKAQSGLSDALLICPNS